MKWRSIIYVAIIFLCVLYGAYVGAAKYEYPLSVSFIIGSLSGLIVGLILVGLLSVILWLARIFREKTPRLARLIGNIFFWLGCAAAIGCVGLAVYMVYVGLPAPSKLVRISLGSAVLYFALGWSIRRILTGQWRLSLSLFRRDLAATILQQTQYPLPEGNNNPMDGSPKRRHLTSTSDWGAIREATMRVVRGLLAIVSVGVAVWIVYYGIMYGRHAYDPIWEYFVFPPIFLLNAFCLISNKPNGGPRIFRLLNLWLEVKENDLRSRLRGTNTLSHPK